MTTATAAKLHTTARHFITCKACETVHLFIGTRYERNGMFCTCLTNGASALAYWFTFDGPKVLPAAKASAIRATHTETKCGDACRSAKSDKCACECAGENHGANLGREW